MCNEYQEPVRFDSPELEGAAASIQQIINSLTNADEELIKLRHENRELAIALMGVLRASGKSLSLSGDELKDVRQGYARGDRVSFAYWRDDTGLFMSAAYRRAKV